MININLTDITKNIDKSKVTESRESYSRDIAIIGISAKLPLAENIDDFWNNLKAGRNCITELPQERKIESDTYLKFTRKNSNELNYKKGSYLGRLDEFDCRFFNISPREASLMDPNQRLFLECAWNAIADAGYGGDKLKGSNTGIYYGYASDMAYQRFIADIEPSSVGMSIPGNLASVIPGRVSYILDLEGPSLVIDTACSSSLVAVHTACCAIKNEDCDMALVGSGKISLLPIEDDNMLGIESKNYTCRAFDDDSDGTCMGEGIFAFVLKPFSKAKKDKDNIYAVIKGSAINQDGSSAGITAPNALAQAKVIERAWKDASIDPNTITYIETHGTGTKLGDPIEIDGITRAFSNVTTRKQFCAIGSVKSNLGHLDSAAGMAGLLKAVLSLKNKMLPPSINFSKPNRNIQFQNTPVYVNHKLIKWESDDSPRRCGVSAFGLSGTNCHIVLEEAPETRTVREIEYSENVLTLSAKTEEALKRMIENYIRYFNKAIEGTLGDVCYSANTGNGHYNYRLAIISKDLDELKEKLNYLNENSIKSCEEKEIFYSQFKVVSNTQKSMDEFEISEYEQKRISKIANKKLKVLKNDEEKLTVLKEICSFYIKGANILWNGLYLTENYRRVSLPAYPFERRRCWIDIPKEALENNNKAAKNNVANSLGKKDSDQFAETKKVILKGKNNGSYSDTEIELAQIWGEVLGFDELDINDNFYELGGDSLIAMKIVNRLNTSMNKSVKISELIEFQTVKNFAAHIDNQTGNGVNQGLVVGEVYLTPSQKVFFKHLLDTKDIDLDSKHNMVSDITLPKNVRTNTSTILFRRERFNEGMIVQILEKIVEHHDALRMVFKVVDGNIVQYNRGLEGELFELKVIELTNDLEDKKQIEIEADKIQGSFSLETGPLLKLGLFKAKEGDHLLIVGQHLVFDGESFRILMEDLMTGFLKALNGEEIKFNKKTCSYKDYANRLHAYANSDEIKKELDYWIRIKKTYTAPLPKDKETNDKRMKYTKFESACLSEEDTTNLMKYPQKAFNLGVRDVLLIAFGLTLKQCTSNNVFSLMVLGNGRDIPFKDIDLARTIGWVSIGYPIVLDMSKSDNIFEQIRYTKEVLKAVPGNGAGYQILEQMYSHENKSFLQINRMPEILFNFLGVLESNVTNSTGLVEASTASLGDIFGDEFVREYSFALKAFIAEGKLELVFDYSTLEYNEITISNFIERYIQNLKKILEISLM